MSTPVSECGQAATRFKLPAPSLGCLSTLITLLILHATGPVMSADDFRPVKLAAKIDSVQPMTGIVLWATNGAVKTAPIQLEYSYLQYDQIVTEKGQYNWSVLEELLDAVASRGHQAIIRWNDTYVAKPTGVPAYIKKLPDYKETTGKSENKTTGFPDWSHPELRRFVLEFFTTFADKYDRDPRIAFVEVGFGLWAEYHIYDGPMKLGQTFPSREFQSEFALHLGKTFRETPWMISVDAAGDHAPFASDPQLLDLPFGVFDDSFNHAKHSQYNEPNWEALRRDRWKIAPTGGEFSFFEKIDQTAALSAKGPHGIPFEQHAARFHISFMIGDAQPRHQPPARIRDASLACGYRFRVTRFEATATAAKVEVRNDGIAPIYYDAHPAVNGIRSKESLKGLLPGEVKEFTIDAGGSAPTLTIECDRLVKNQRITYDADLQ
ncbi:MULTISPECIES: DUF4832 domain-containing protein [unclassified Schlesneria]|uniref:DUF4832 domain-containing protein n=1 Tax=Schlesneria TaxID=656899 RepID=UPI002F118863